jgi:hypothetical protein
MGGEKRKRRCGVCGKLSYTFYTLGRAWYRCVVCYENIEAGRPIYAGESGRGTASKRTDNSTKANGNGT